MTSPVPPERDPRWYYAHTYLRFGWPVFVLGRSKRPVANCHACSTAPPEHDPAACGCLTCHGFYAATTEPDRIRAMLAAATRGLLAIRTGAVSGLTVVDIDPRNGGRLDPALMPPTAYVTTAGGGLHLYYRHPGDKRIPCHKNLPGHPGVDVKADGGYVVAPPSQITPTRGYMWAGSAVSGSALLNGVNEMPPALIARCLCHPTDTPRGEPSTPEPGRPYGPHTPGSGGRGISSPEALLTAHLDAVRRAPEGSRRTTLYGAARGVARMVALHAITPDDAVRDLTAIGQAVGGVTDREIRAAIIGGFTAENVTIPTSLQKVS